MANEIYGKTIASTYKKLLFTKNNNGLNGASAGSERIICTDDGDGVGSGITESCLAVGTARVGIGTDVPAYTLDIDLSGNERVAMSSGSSSTPNLYFTNNVGTSSGHWKIDMQGTNYGNNFIQIGRDAGDHDIALMGNVGIGVTTPTSPLTISVPANGTGSQDDADQDKFALMIQHPVSDNNYQAGIGFNISADQSASANPGAAITHERTGADSQGKLHLKTSSTDGQLDTRLTIDKDGNVGIGTVSPAQPLEVNGPIRIDNTDCRLELHDTTAEAGGDDFVIQNQNGEFKIWNDTDGDRVDFIIDGDGNVGIGAITPGSKLEVMSATGSNCVVEINTTDTGDSTSDAMLQFSEGGTKQWVIWNDGSLADDDGRIYVTDRDGNNGVYMVEDAQEWTGNSDERMKENLVELINATANLNTLRCVNYNMKNGTAKSRSKKRIGLIAQDLYKVYPEATVGNPDDVYEYNADAENYKHKNAMGVTYTDLIPVLVKAVQELSTKVTALENA